MWTESEQLRDAVKEFARDALTWLTMPPGENENQTATTVAAGRQPVLVFAGGKGVGKSTACRYALNTLLNWCVHFSCIQFAVFKRNGSHSREKMERENESRSIRSFTI